MLFSCSRCHTRYKLPDEKVTNRILKVRCKTCGAIVVVRDPRLPPNTRPAPRVPKDDPIWYAALEGRQEGPFTRAMLHRFAGDGRVDGTTYVWRAGMENWVRLVSVQELAGVLDLSVEANRPPPLPPSTPGRRDPAATVASRSAEAAQPVAVTSEEAPAPSDEPSPVTPDEELSFTDDVPDETWIVPRPEDVARVAHAAAGSSVEPAPDPAPVADPGPVSDQVAAAETSASPPEEAPEEAPPGSDAAEEGASDPSRWVPAHLAEMQPVDQLAHVEGEEPPVPDHPREEATAPDVEARLDGGAEEATAPDVEARADGGAEEATAPDPEARADAQPGGETAPDIQSHSEVPDEGVTAPDLPARSDPDLQSRDTDTIPAVVSTNPSEEVTAKAIAVTEDDMLGEDLFAAFDRAQEVPTPEVNPEDLDLGDIRPPTRDERQALKKALKEGGADGEDAPRLTRRERREVHRQSREEFSVLARLDQQRSRRGLFFFVAAALLVSGVGISVWVWQQRTDGRDQAMKERFQQGDGRAPEDVTRQTYATAADAGPEGASMTARERWAVERAREKKPSSTALSSRDAPLPPGASAVEPPRRKKRPLDAADKKRFAALLEDEAGSRAPVIAAPSTVPSKADQVSVVTARAEKVSEVFARKRRQLAKCKDDVEEKIKVEFTLSRIGRVERATVTGTKNARKKQCVQQILGRAIFPAGEGTDTYRKTLTL